MTNTAHCLIDHCEFCFYIHLIIRLLLWEIPNASEIEYRPVRITNYKLMIHTDYY